MSLFRRLRDRVQPLLEKGAKAVDPDRALMVATAALIERARVTYPDLRYGRWRPGEPLRLLFAGYSGTRNTGADVRVEEMLRQFRHVLGDENLALSVLTYNPKLTRGYFRRTQQIEMPLVFPKFMYDQVADQHGVIACEGSMFKSKFASALSTMMVQSLGLASAGDKLSIAYGGEAGKMDPVLEKLVERYASDAFVITRNQSSRDVLGRLGIKTHLGTDTAWSFHPAPPSVGRQILLDAGWDGQQPVLALCPINPFWWPVRPDVVKGASHAVFGLHEHEHYRSVYFHRGGSDVAEAQEQYLQAIARGVQTFRQQQDVFCVCIGSEQLDREACERLAELVGNAPVFGSDELEMYEMVSLMRQATYMVSSRYHAIVMTMAAGVLSIGVTMDERIRNLMIDRGTPEFALEVDQPDLGEALARSLEAIASDPGAHRVGIERTVVRNLEVMGHMGAMLAGHVRDQLPRFPMREEMRRRGDPWAHLPPLSPLLQELVQTHRGAHDA
jgi:polysaccharide pyruvyl transferase WcaK-like protein